MDHEPSGNEKQQQANANIDVRPGPELVEIHHIMFFRRWRIVRPI
jgi:hypothetical protein